MQTKSALNKKIIQSVSDEDFSSLRELASKYPLLNLPSEENLLKEKIKISEQSFAKDIPEEKRNFLFVLKEENGAVIGSSQLAIQSGTPIQPSYSLKIFHQNTSEAFLQLIKITDGPSYLGGLILSEHYRGQPEKAGKQLSLIRFLFAAMFPKIFKKTFHAEVAPYLDEKGKNPFFEYFIKQYTSLSMEEIDYLTLTDKEKLFSFYPREKVLFSTLPDSVQKSLGKAGFYSQRAAGLLNNQNFSFVGEVDPFDGGPYLQAHINNIPLIQKTKEVFLKEEKLNSNINLTPQKTKWLWALMKNNKFYGGVLEGFLQSDFLFVSKEDLYSFKLTENTQIFISPFS